jgi:hypothetical protein
MATALDAHQLATKNGYPQPGTYEGHACPECGAPVPCAFQELARAKAHAKSDLLAATMAERKLLGLPLGAPKKLADLSPEQLEEMVKRFGNINRARKTLGVGWATFYRRMTGDTTRR